MMDCNCEFPCAEWAPDCPENRRKADERLSELKDLGRDVARIERAHEEGLLPGVAARQVEAIREAVASEWEKVLVKC